MGVAIGSLIVSRILGSKPRSAVCMHDVDLEALVWISVVVLEVLEMAMDDTVSSCLNVVDGVVDGTRDGLGHDVDAAAALQRRAV